MSNHITTITNPTTGQEVGVLDTGTGLFYEVYREWELVGSIHFHSDSLEWGFSALDGRSTYGWASMEEAAFHGPAWLGGLHSLVGA